MKFSRRHIFITGVVTALVILQTLLSGAVTPLHAAVFVPRILVINSYNMGYDWWEDEMAGVRAGLAKVYPRVELFIECLDTKKFHTKKHFPAEANLLEAKYANQHLDAIIAMDNAALEFASQYRQRISPGTPLVFCGINDYEPSMIAGQRRITGVAEDHDIFGTLALALRLQPKTTDVIVIHDYTDTGLAIRRELEKTARRFPAVKLQFMAEMPLEEMVEKLKMVTPGHLVLMLSYTREKGGRTFSHFEAARLVSGASPVPVYSVYAAQLGSGVVGGRMMTGQIQGEKAAEMAVRIIGGEPPGKLPVITGTLSRPLFDYRVLKRFGIHTAQLPPDAVLINKPPSTVAIDKTTVWLGAVFTLFSTTGVIVLALNVRKRRRLERMLCLKIDQYQESQEELQATEEMLRAQVDEYLQSQDDLLATEEMLRVQLEAVEESSQKFKAVFEHSPLAVALTSLPDGTFCEVNQAFIDMSGYTREETLGKTTIELGIWKHKSDRDNYLQQLRDYGYVHNFEVKVCRKGGEELDTMVSSAKFNISDRPFVLGIIMDITEQKRLQNQLHQSQKMDVIGQLAGGIAHDFNNMLTGIMAAAELLKLRVPHDEGNHTLIDTIIDAATRSADLTRELLTFSRKGTAGAHAVDINDTIHSVMRLLERTLDKNILLTARLDGGNPAVIGDQTQLQNALLNLGINARDAMPDGGALTYTTAVKTLDEAGCRSMGISLAPGNYLEIAVSDTGAGMEKAIIEHIFEPFFTTKEVGKGTGLGLAVVYGTVCSHHGELHVQSEPGAGSVFTMYLPVIAQGKVFSPLEGDVISGTGGILLVDDEAMLRSAGCCLLEDLGYTVYLAENGEQALEVFANHRSDISLVMLDMIMPKMGGKETFLRLRELAPTLKVIFCSGFNYEGTGADLVELGASGFIQKPYNRRDLSRAVAGVLNQ
ncbi:MAG: response regulator [Proteobacteria bacterium]|nr:response regulator [Pseudomonadota bacterium]